MEASESVVKLKNGEATTLHIMPIANIRTELKLFNAVFYLDRTPLRKLVLEPSSYKESIIPNRIPDFTYTGYVSQSRLIVISKYFRMFGFIHSIFQSRQ